MNLQIIMNFVGRLGVGPSASFLSGKRSTAEPTAQNSLAKLRFVSFHLPFCSICTVRLSGNIIQESQRTPFMASVGLSFNNSELLQGQPEFFHSCNPLGSVK